VIVTIRGAGFVASSGVHWNGTALATTFVSPRELTATVPDALVVAVGLGTVTIISPAPGGGTSNVSYVPVTTLAPAANFPATPSSSINVGTSPVGIVTGDFNADGKIDLAVINYTDNTVSILLGNGDGTFTTQTPIAVGVGPGLLVAGDFNEDGKTDLAVTNFTANTVSILLGNGDGTFTLHSSPTIGASPFGVAAADFNADGHLDLAVTNYAGNTVMILLGNGDGTFVAGTPLAVGVQPREVVVGDFNEDGKLDIAVANEAGNSVSMLLGNGDGTFQPQITTLTVGSGFPIGLIAADFNGDSHLDVAAVNGTDVAILLGDGAGNLTLKSNPAAGSYLISGLTGDFNGDGLLDIVAADQGGGGGHADLLPGNGDGTFGTAVTYTASPGTFGVATADFNGDGALELAFTNEFASNVSIFLQLIPVSLTPASLAFGNQAAGTSSALQVITLRSNSAASVNISAINITGANALEFSHTTTCGAAVAGAGTCTISVTFSPARFGAKVATLSVSDDAANTLQTLALRGTGAVTSQTISKAFGASFIPLGGSTSLSIAIANPSANLTLTGVAFTDSLPAAAGASSVSLATATLAVSSSCTISLDITGTTAGLKNNTVTITSIEAGTGNTANTSVTVTVPPPDLTIIKAHIGHFHPGQIGATYTITVTNAGNGPSSGAVTATDILPAGLTATAISGGGWTCTLGSLSCTRADALAASGSYAALTVIVNVAATAPSSVTNSASVSGGGETNTANDTASDVTIVDAPAAPADFSIAAAATTATVSKGSKAAYLVTLTPLNNVPFATSIKLAVSGVPGCTAFYFQPASVTPGANPATSALLLFTSTADTAIATNINRRTAPLFALGFVFGMPLAGLVLAGLRRKNSGLNLKSRGAAILLFVLTRRGVLWMR
jgi:uncharacterized repeat protein (TIGR01451 family)